MDKQLATSVFESLSSGVRLDIFRLLVKTGPQGLVAGEIGTTLEVPPTNLSFHLKALTHAQLVSVVQEGRFQRYRANLSFHLKALTHAQLVSVVQEGRFQRYRANLSLMQELIVYLTAECCAGHPEQCAEISLAPLCP